MRGIDVDPFGGGELIDGPPEKLLQDGCDLGLALCQVVETFAGLSATDREGSTSELLEAATSARAAIERRVALARAARN